MRFSFFPAVCPAIGGAVVLLTAGLGVAQTSGAGNAATSPFTEASYCYHVSRAFQDRDLERRWRSTRSKYLLLLPEDQQWRISSAARTKVASEAKSLSPALFRSRYEGCRESLAGAEAEARAANEAWVRAYSAQRDARKAPYLNPYAPPPYSAMELAGDLAATRDPAAQETFRHKSRAWNAYCLVAAHALYLLSAENPAGFGLDPKRAEAARLLAMIDGQRAKFRAALLQGFPADGQPQAQKLLDAQKENFSKGLALHKGQDSAIAQFAKVQAFACDSGFELAWGSVR